jgi:trehalose 6-phosphate phosphatase
VKNILTEEEEKTLRRFARGRVLLAFDFDGTLAPIVREPAAAAMRARTEKLMTELAQLYPCVVISGRARADVMEKLDEVPLRAVIGNHGMEPSPNLRRAAWLVAFWRAQLATSLPHVAGITVEDKRVTLAIHYRKARARAAIRKAILLAAAELPDARIMEGKMVVNVIPAGAPDKASALRSLCKRMRCASAIYVGDDENDEGVFALARKGRLLAIRVGRSTRSLAPYFVASQAAIDRLLMKLIEARTA